MFHEVLVAIDGSPDEGAVGSVLLGSVSHYVRHHSPIPALIVHVEAPDRATEETTAGDLEMSR